MSSPEDISDFLNRISADGWKPVVLSVPPKSAFERVGSYSKQQQGSPTPRHQQEAQHGLVVDKSLIQNDIDFYKNSNGSGSSGSSSSSSVMDLSMEDESASASLRNGPLPEFVKFQTSFIPDDDGQVDSGDVDDDRPAADHYAAVRRRMAGHDTL
eukprot:ANDGO_06131.mRNA.1 hypothetical protein